jgi:hypothetical protein
VSHQAQAQKMEVQNSNEKSKMKYMQAFQQ